MQVRAILPAIAIHDNAMGVVQSGRSHTRRIRIVAITIAWYAIYLSSNLKSCSQDGNAITGVSMTDTRLK